MVWSDPTNFQGVIQNAYFKAFGDALDHSGDWSLPMVTARGNIALAKVAKALWNASDIWAWDDSNQNTLPVATANLVSGQTDYTLATSILQVRGVSILDINGNWEPLDQIDPLEIERETGMDFDYYQNIPGLPGEYALIGNSIWLKPAADNGISCTMTAGLKIWLSRSTTQFAVPASYSTADTTIPGFDSDFHDILPCEMAADYLEANNQEGKAASLRGRSEALIAKMVHTQGLRDKDKPDVIGMKSEDLR
jgi:hypothetical protein